MNLTGKGFGAYDVRGVYPDEVNEELAYRVGRVFVDLFQAKKVAVGHDIRLSGPSIQEALVRGLTEAGADVMDIGQCGTEMIYFATGHYELDGGIMITASHNPKQYNGMKFVRKGSRPISSDTGLKDIEKAALADSGEPLGRTLGKVEKKDILDEYVAHILTYVDIKKLKPFKIVANTGNGAAGPIINALEKHLPFDIVKVYNEPDGSFPNGVPNPILQENREATAKVVRESGAVCGIAWDGDFDRCFMFDEKGGFIEGYYMVGFLAEAFLKKSKGEKVIYDPRLIWNTIEIAEELGGEAVICKSGHAFIKDKMREVNAIYGGEMSAHHYFRDFFYCDSGMIPWLLMLELMSQTDKTLSELMKYRMERYPISGEINSKVADAKAVMEKVEAQYGPSGKVVKIDGLSVDYDKWRFNLRMSNTEPVIRLNVETKQDAALLKEKTDELLAVIRG
ncbi:phosphohexose mutase [Selenomonas sp. TAMA-11512]|uniref:phosphomannomutase n=1 Tax=Selenomonas sp. TAMA-11512 TaxID=3095337 RepID=UPI0030879829|nr:phosphohexose mutase [Selenomonas sp. TAMA-11512]